MAAPIRLIREDVVDIKAEVLEEASGQPKSYYLLGRYMQTEQLNKNGRKYPKHIIENELQRYQPFIDNKSAKALGELGHPDTPSINLHLVSHRIADLKFEGNDVMGRAKILGTPNGEIVKKFIDDGITLGMSSRGLGSVKSIGGYDQVQEDFRLATVDIVADPSGLDCFVNGILENVDWVFANGVWKQIPLSARTMVYEASQAELESVAINIFSGMLRQIIL